MNFWLAIVVVFCGISFNVCEGGIVVLDSDDPGSCDKTNHAEEVLVKDRENKEKILICTENNGIYQWRTIDGVSPPGELFNPGYDCSNILDKEPEAKDGFYWIQLDGYIPKKVWCDMTTDGGGFMLIGRKNDSITWTVPSNNYPVEPFGDRHWSSALGDAPILDFRIQMATSEDFKQTKAHWSFRLQSKRPLKNLMVMNQGGCNQAAGIGDIAYVKDLQTEKIVSTTFRCSMFGFAHQPSTKFGWSMMNSCLQKPCSRGFAFFDHHAFKWQTDHSGAFSYSVTGNVSGIHHDSTAFIGCDNNVCCSCYGPLGGTGNYCGDDCQAKPGGIITKNVYTWFWMRSALPKRIWNKCMEYQVTADNGDIVWYKLKDGSGVPKKGRCAKNEALLNDGIVVVPDSAAAKKIPSVPGLMEYRKDNKKLYVRANKTWNVVAQEDKVLKKTSEMVEPKLNEFEKRFDNQNQVDNRQNTELSRIETRLGNVNQTLQSIIALGISYHPECSSYSWITDATRNKNNKVQGSLCDSTLSTGWYRFGGKAGTKMLNTCVPEWRCGTYITGWMNGNHPTVSDGNVARTACFHWINNCCRFSTSIEVLNCGYFFIYKLTSTPFCTLRYCGSDN